MVSIKTLKTRWKNLLKSICQTNVDAVLLTQKSLQLNPNFYYLTGLQEPGLLLIKPAQSTLFFPRSLPNPLPDLSFLQIKIINKKNNQKSLLKFNKTLTYGLDFAKTTLQSRKNLNKLGIKKVQDVSALLLQLRQVKDARELNLIRKAYSLSNKILNQIFQDLSSKDSKLKSRLKTELDLQNYLRQQAHQFAHGLSFPSIASANKNSSEIHHLPKNKKLKGFVMIDFGISYHYYCSDTTRMVYFGSPKKQEKEDYHALRQIQQELLDEIKTGDKAKSLVVSAHQKLAQHNWVLDHGLGHGFGLEIHEKPSLVEKSPDPLLPYSTCTLEPGVYLKNYGLRIEDGLIINKNKIENLNKNLTKDLLTF